jgi:hypothetical protein
MRDEGSLKELKMDRDDMLTTRVRILSEARALRATFPDVTAMGLLPVGALPPVRPDGGGEEAAWRSAFGGLHDEMLLVRSDKVTDLTVLDDEMKCVEQLLAGR